MPRKRKFETDQERNERLETSAQKLRDASSEEEDALDAMVRKSIKLHGA
jgi:hypothetical protein